MVLRKHYVAYLFRSKLDFRNLLTLIIGSLLIELTSLRQRITFSRNLNCHWECRNQSKIFQSIVVKIFWNFTMFWYRSNLPQEKQTLISSITNLAYNVRLDHHKWRNIRQISNLGVGIAQWSVSLQEIKVWQYQSKNMQKKVSNYFCPVQFYWISLFCSKFLDQDCSLLKFVITKHLQYK